MGMTTLRHKIMADFDTWDGSTRVREPSLGREDLEHWMKGTYLSVTKFQYVDYWIRKNRNIHPISQVLDDLIDYKEDEYRKRFSELYTADFSESADDIDHHLDELNGAIFYSDIVKIPKVSDDIQDRHSMMLGGKRQIAIFFREHSHYSSSITAAYLENPISDLRPNFAKRDIVICFGYMTVEKKGYGQFETISGPLHVFRDRARGSYLSGTSVSQCIIQMHDYEMRTTWYPQLASQFSENSYMADLKAPALQNVDDEGEFSNIGTLRLRRSIDLNDKLLEYVKSLKNRYLVW